MKFSYIFLPILFSLLLIPAYAEHFLPIQVTDVYATIEYQIIGTSPNERVQLDIEFFDHESNHLDLNINYDIYVTQSDGNNPDNGYDRLILYTPADEYDGNLKATHETETLHYSVTGQHSIYIELRILGVGDFLPFPIEFEETNPLVYTLTRNNGNPFEADFRP